MIIQTLIAFAAVALLGLVLRLFFGRDRSSTLAWPPADPDDFGLLATAALVESADEADRIRTMLTDAGIKATIAPAADGLHRVLVFATELAHARRVAG